MTNSQIIAAIKTCMSEQKLTMYRISQITGFSQSHVGRILREENKPNFDTLQSICGAVGLQLTLTTKTGK